MKILLSWLKDYVDIDVSAEELEEKLFGAGFEVEETIYLGRDIEKVVVGEVTSIEKYEGTHLYICHVDCGEFGKDNVILTGADNVFKGAKVPAAVVGAKLPGGIEIAPRKMADMMSYGMLCSGGELGLDDNWIKGAEVNGILILPEDSKVGEDIKTVLGLDDYVFDISITANRPDCQSVLGIAREVAAFLGKPLKEPDYAYDCTDKTTPDTTITVEAPDVCPRYIGHYVYDVKHFESPEWMKRRLSVCGFSAIDAIVDVTNYVLLEIGQPMHAFDMDTLEGRSIIVRRAEDSEKLTTLDEKERVLTPENLLICDKAKAVGLAGVMGGLNSEIKPSTSEVLFECAKFRRDSVRKTARALGMHTDAAARYEKGVDEYGTERGMARALNLVQTLGIATIGATHIDVNAGEDAQRTVFDVTVPKINSVLGIEVPQAEIVKILKSLQFGVAENGGTLTVTVPRWRTDVEHYQDIAEEVIREYGYSHVVPTFLDSAQVTNGGLAFFQSKELAAKKFLCAEGCYEVQTLAMYSKRELDMIMLPENDPRRTVVELLNPITDNLSIMRTVMAPCMINVIASNVKNDHGEGRFFELANVYLPKALPLTEQPEERKTLCIGAYGADESFFTVKETLESFAAVNGLKFRYERGSEPFLHSGICADIYCNGEKIGTLGKLRYEIVEGLNVAEGKKNDLNIILAELNYSAIESLYKREIRFVPDSGRAVVKRDLSLICDKKTLCVEIEDVIAAASALAKEIRLFDSFESEKLGFGKKSLTFSITFADDSDVTDEIADGEMSAVTAALKEKLGAVQRA
ncbi:MAG: phenylalanine--tRNA ligase subunit beta [Lachnospiraceae bacterium]|nr:phenylalanine--tRNA ligase subunit beta [Ruminococcus sp.]MCM1275892.1 phenylalanine--tRNA ligase subunit beta [Lachnospiraceae bacterium]